MAHESTWPTDTTTTGTAWKTRSGALVHRIQNVRNAKSQGWFCTGCLHLEPVNPNFTERIEAEAQTHADGCTGVQV